MDLFSYQELYGSLPFWVELELQNLQQVDGICINILKQYQTMWHRYF